MGIVPAVIFWQNTILLHLYMKTKKDIISHRAWELFLEKQDVTEFHTHEEFTLRISNDDVFEKEVKKYFTRATIEYMKEVTNRLHREL